MSEEGYYILFSVDLRTVTWGRLGPQIAYLKKLTNPETRNSFLKQQFYLVCVMVEWYRPAMLLKRDSTFVFR